ncbi:MAG: hypothetical protein FVQ80_16595 [Planctomycetes bacterium]|nr:hypothetical protein [Planctomycetota bacterium]
MHKKATGSKDNVVHVINSINISSLGTKDLAEVEAIIKEKVNASIKLYEQLKVLITMLVKYTQSFASRPQSVDSLERITRRRSVNPDVLRTIRLVQYILAITIYLVKGDDRLLKEMKPAEVFF